MAEQEDKTEVATEPLDRPGRDELGLTLSTRQILRIMMEYGRIAIAAGKTGQSTHLAEIAANPTMTLEILNLLVLAHGVGRKIGKPTDVTSYLRRHEDEDLETLETLKREFAGEYKNKTTAVDLIESLLKMKLDGGGPCEVCGETKCQSCGQCHDCAKRKDHPLN